jgi:8-oxo-dGTP pyrophosphatase MutT (NUDIX family)
MQIDPRLAEVDDCLYRLSVRALIVHESKILLVREKDSDWWAFPGGGIDYGEDTAQAFTRELAEELGVSATDFKTDYKVVFISTKAIAFGIPRVNLFYYADIPTDRIHGGADVDAFAWFTPDELTSEIISRYIGTSPDDQAEFMRVIKTRMAR